MRLTVLPDMLLFRITYMEKTMKKLIIMTAILIGLSVPAVAEIEIKGFKLDMTKKEAKANWKEVRIKSKWMNAKLIPHHYMTLAGIPVPKPIIWYDKKSKAKPVTEMAWFFCYDDGDACQMQGDKGHSATTFSTIVEALKTKYPLECTTSTLQNGFGAKYEDRLCMYESNGVTLKTERYEDDLTGGRISIYIDDGRELVKTDDL